MNFQKTSTLLLTLFLVLSGRTGLVADCNLTHINLVSSTAAIQWNSRAGYVYAVLSAESPGGPWTERARVTASGTSSTWTDAQSAGGVPGRFYRIQSPSADGCSPDAGLDSVTQAALYEADTAPRVLMTTFENSRQVAVGGVYLASQLAAGGQQLVSTGTVTQQGQTWSYSAEPADHLVVKLTGLGTQEIFLEAIQGDFSGDASTFLGNNHVLKWRMRADGLGDLNFTSSRSGRIIQASAKGTMPWNGGDVAVDVSSVTDHYFESSFGGSETITDTQVSGTMTSAGFSLSINQRLRFQIISQNGTSASTNQEWLSSQLDFQGTTYRWADVTKQKSFRDGKPSGVDDYWNATGRILRNGAAFGQYGKTYTNVGGVVGKVNFVVQFPTQTVVLESWTIL